MPWWWLWLTAGVHRAAFGPRESLVESLVGELVALSGRESRREGAASQHRLLLVLPFLQSLKGQDFVPVLHGGAALRVKKCFYERARTASPAHTQRVFTNCFPGDGSSLPQLGHLPRKDLN